MDVTLFIFYGNTNTFLDEPCDVLRSSQRLQQYGLFSGRFDSIRYGHSRMVPVSDQQRHDKNAVGLDRGKGIFDVRRLLKVARRYRKKPGLCCGDSLHNKAARRPRPGSLLPWPMMSNASVIFCLPCSASLTILMAQRSPHMEHASLVVMRVSRMCFARSPSMAVSYCRCQSSSLRASDIAEVHGPGALALAFLDRVGHVGGDPCHDRALADVVGRGQREVLGRRDHAQEVRAGHPGDGAADRAHDVVVARRDVGHQRPQKVQRGVAGQLFHDFETLMPTSSSGTCPGPSTMDWTSGRPAAVDQLAQRDAPPSAATGRWRLSCTRGACRRRGSA